MPGEASEKSSLSSQETSESEPSRQISLGTGQERTAAYSERMRARQKAFDFFRSQFTVDTSSRSITTTITNSEGRENTIGIGIIPESQKVESVDLDQEEPVRFLSTKYSLYFYRKAPDIKAVVEENLTADAVLIEPDLSWINSELKVEELDEQAKNFDANNSEQAILADLRQKFTSLGFANIPIEVYAKRLLIRDVSWVNQTVSQAKADLMMPLYRLAEIKRFMNDPTSSAINHFQMVSQRQHLYDQLTNLLRESGMNPEEMTRYLVEGIFDSHLIAGVPVFSYRSNRYLVIDCTFGGYDETNPIGTDFDGVIIRRSTVEIRNIVQKAEDAGYTTHVETSTVSGGIHQHWQWHGISIEGFDEVNPENNISRILKILKDLGINPNEAVSTTNPMNIPDLYMR